MLSRFSNLSNLSLEQCEGKAIAGPSCLLNLRSLVQELGSGDTNILSVLNKFRQLYEDRLKWVDEINCDSLSQTYIKVEVLQDWVHDLNEQNIKLLKLVEDLETSAKEKPVANERKIQNKILSLQNDIMSLLFMIRRSKSTGCLCARGLKFINFTHEEIFRDNHDIFRGKQSVVSDAEMSNKEDVININGDEMERLSAKCKCLYEELNAKNINLQRTSGEVSNLRSQLQEKEMKILETEEMLRSLNVKLIQSENVNDDLRKEIESLKEKELRISSLIEEDDVNRSNELQTLKSAYDELKDVYKKTSAKSELKDQIIKDMRREIKSLRSQLGVTDEGTGDTSNQRVSSVSTRPTNTLFERETAPRKGSRRRSTARSPPDLTIGQHQMKSPQTVKKHAAKRDKRHSSFGTVLEAPNAGPEWVDMRRQYRKTCTRKTCPSLQPQRLDELQDQEVPYGDFSSLPDNTPVPLYIPCNENTCLMMSSDEQGDRFCVNETCPSNVYYR